MEKFALCSRVFWDKEILDKCNELDDKNKRIKALEDKIKELKNKIGRFKIVLVNYTDYCNKLNIVHDMLAGFLERD